MYVSRRALLGAALGLPFARASEAAAKLTSVQVLRGSRIPLVRPDWPVPDEPNQLFYIQRSTNPNTIVYTGRYLPDGRLHPEDPAVVYWRRYNTTGERKPLNAFERRFAFGLRKQKHAAPGNWTVWAAAAPQFPMRVQHVAPFRSEVRTPIAGIQARPAYCFAHVDESGLIPRVVQFSIHGTDPSSGQAVSEIFSVSGGLLSQ